MAELGSVFETIDDEDVPAGPDLRVTIEIPRAALGHSFLAAVPRRIAAEGDIVDRAVDPAHPDQVLLHLPEQLPDGAVLRLRGQGGAAEEPEGRPGDLHAIVELVDRAPTAEELPDGPLVAREEAHPVLGAGRDITWMILLGLALIAGAVVAAIAL